MLYDRNGKILEEEDTKVTFEEILNKKIGKESSNKKEEKKKSVRTPSIPSGYENTIDGYRIMHRMNAVCDMRIFKN